MPKDQKKPFEVTVDGKLVWSLLTPVAAVPASGQGKPLFFEAESKWFGAPKPEWAAYMDSCVGVSASVGASDY